MKIELEISDPHRNLLTKPKDGKYSPRTPIKSFS
jgi:hypothetical protein